jgi:adenylyltransferase/sulfurtransferase
MPLSFANRQRYARQLALPDFGEQGQLLLQKSHIAIIGAGGLAATSFAYLAAAGVGEISIWDDDIIEASNLPRQILFATENLGQEKTSALAHWSEKNGSETKIHQHKKRFSAADISLLKNISVVIDATDNIQSRHEIHLSCRSLKIPFIFGAAAGFSGMVSSFLHQKNSACFACFCPETISADSLRTCAQTGMLGPVVGLIGCLQTTESLRILLNKPSFSEKLIRVDFDSTTRLFSSTKILPDPACGICQKND